MPAPTIVIAQSDPDIAEELARDLHAHFARVAVAQDLEELRTMLLRHEARVAVLDLEFLSMDEIHDLAGMRGDLMIVCTHRLPDEQMWMEALNAGAAELCHPYDLHTILHAAHSVSTRHMPLAA